MQIKLAFGKTGLWVDLPEGPSYEMLKARPGVPLPDVTSALDFALDHPIGSLGLQQLARGKTNKEIADGMFLSNKTVSTYKTRLLLKLNARSLVDLIELAQRNGLV